MKLSAPPRTRKPDVATGEEAGSRILVVTVVHHPQDSRIWFRQIDALLAHGWKITFAAPFSGYGLPVPPDHDAQHGSGSLHCIDVPRSHGRRRIGAGLAARRVIREQAPHHDLVLLHDPELVLSAAGLGIDHVVWDVHEDAAAAIHVKEWMPRALRPGVAQLWRALERVAERKYRLLLAESAYQVRFERTHPVVPNAVTVPSTITERGWDRVIYLGSVTRARGSLTMIEVGRELRRRTDGAMRLEVVGEAHDPLAATELHRAHQRGDLVWHGFLPSDEALKVVSGALAGLSLLEDQPNFRSSMPTKVIEYCAMGLPVITTPLPLAVDLVRRAEAGVVVPWHDPAAVVDALLMLRDHPARAQSMAENGYREARDHHDWRDGSIVFVALMELMAKDSGTVRATRVK
ncbi:MAG TPA: glycosyltransferase [Propionibacteriaceae bacterium]|nr:glycosyltransferase [Propionibacteriaceae bacterium]